MHSTFTVVFKIIAFSSSLSKNLENAGIYTVYINDFNNNALPAAWPGSWWGDRSWCPSDPDHPPAVWSTWSPRQPFDAFSVILQIISVCQNPNPNKNMFPSASYDNTGTK